MFSVVDVLRTYFRMEQMQKRLPEIMLQKPDTDVEENEDGGGDSETNLDAESNHDADNRNEDGDVEN